jgi:CheY-like chemotaxis protein
MSHILFADDDAHMRRMVGDLLRAAGHDVRVVDGGRAALERVLHDPPDLVVLDYLMGDPNGFAVCRTIKADPRFVHIPVLILTGQGEVEYRIEGFDAGANDYLPKPFEPRELVARVEALLRLSRQSLDRNPTTRLPGGQAVEREFERRCTQGTEFCICYFDLDDFKPFNDHFGFATADAVIRDAGSVLGAVASTTGAFAGHIGGDDFVMMCNCGEVHRLVQRVQQGFREALPRHVPARVVAAGHYLGIDREGRTREIPLTRFAAAIVRVAPEACRHMAELSQSVAEAKHRAKHAADGVAEIGFPDGEAREEGDGGRSGAQAGGGPTRRPPEGPSSGGASSSRNS